LSFIVICYLFAIRMCVSKQMLTSSCNEFRVHSLYARLPTHDVTEPRELLFPYTLYTLVSLGARNGEYGSNSVISVLVSMCMRWRDQEFHSIYCVYSINSNTDGVSRARISRRASYSASWRGDSGVVDIFDSDIT